MRGILKVCTRRNFFYIIGICCIIILFIATYALFVNVFYTFYDELCGDLAVVAILETHMPGCTNDLHLYITLIAVATTVLIFFLIFCVVQLCSFLNAAQKFILFIVLS